MQVLVPDMQKCLVARCCRNRDHNDEAIVPPRTYAMMSNSHFNLYLWVGKTKHIWR